MFVDRAVIYVAGGNGGSGCVSFRREKYVPKGGPNGGDGGNGGNVILRPDNNMSTLLDFRFHPHYKAERAQHGKGSNKHGKCGSDLIIKVPLGTIVRDQATGEICGDLTEPSQSLIVAKGGKGGRGNARFVSSTNRTPRQWEPGEYGEERVLELELKLIADVGLVGLPNAGKSTLISKLSAARPKVADYPFTTLQPNLGIVKYRDIGSFIIADMPGIIEGAHLGKGLGHQFLRHIERTRFLILLVDCTSDDLIAEIDLLKSELAHYQPRLPDRIGFVLLTKSDLSEELTYPDATAVGLPVYAVSSVTGEGLAELKDTIWKELDASRKDILP